MSTINSPSSSQASSTDRKSTRLNSSHTEIYTLSLHDALPISAAIEGGVVLSLIKMNAIVELNVDDQLAVVEPGVINRSEEHTSELQSHRDLHSFPTRRSSDLGGNRGRRRSFADQDERDRRVECRRSTRRRRARRHQ